MDHYRLELAAGDELRVSVSTRAPAPFVPGLVLVGAGIQARDSAPGIAVPRGMGALILDGVRSSRAELESFTPMALYETAAFRGTVNVTAPVYVLVIADGSGRYVLGSGYLEEFSPAEWLMIPIDRLRIHLWQGQSPLLVIGPLAAVVIAGGFLLALRGNRIGAAPLLAALAGLIFLGSGLGLLVETGIALLSAEPTAAVVVPVLLALVGLVLGGFALQAALQPGDLRAADRAMLAAVAAVALLTWSGVMVGPVLVLIAAALPGRAS